MKYYRKIQNIIKTYAVTTQVNKAGAGDEPASYELCLGVAVSIDVGING